MSRNIQLLLVMMLLFCTAETAAEPREGCYWRFQINELDNGKGSRLFSATEVNAVYAALTSATRLAGPEDGSDFLLIQKSSRGELEEVYALHSTLSMNVEDFSAKTSVSKKVSRSLSVMDVVIPEPPVSSTFEILVAGKTQPLRMRFPAQRCFRSCKIEGEVGRMGKERCCLEFLPVHEGKETFRCVRPAPKR